MPEIRRLLWRLVLVVQHAVDHILAWSPWRRWHQAVATYYHDPHREAVAAASAA